MDSLHHSMRCEIQSRFRFNRIVKKGGGNQKQVLQTSYGGTAVRACIMKAKGSFGAFVCIVMIHPYDEMPLGLQRNRVMRRGVAPDNRER